MGVDISSAGGSDMCQGSVVFCLRDVMLRSYFIPNPTEITSFSCSNFLSSCALDSPALKQGPLLSCSLDGKHQTKGVGTAAQCLHYGWDNILEVCGAWMALLGSR